MKKILFLLMMLPMMANAQRVDKPGEPYEYFCILKVEVGYTSLSFSSKNWGFRELLDENDKRLGFSNGADAVNYMTKRGWIYVDHIDSKTFIIKKIVSSDEQAKEYLNLEKKKEK